LFVGEYSADNANWQLLSSSTIAMAAQGYVGMAVAAHNAGGLNSTTFENVSFAPMAKLSSPLLSVSVGASALNLSWSAQPLASGFTLQRSTTADFSAGVTNTDLPEGTTSYSDPTPDASVSYYYRVISKANGPAADSNPSNVTGASLAGRKIVGQGVGAQYFSNLWSDGAPAVLRSEPDIRHPWEGGVLSVFPAPGTVADRYSSVWTGKIKAEVDGEYTFISSTDDYGYLWVNGQLVSFDPGGHGTRDADLSDTGGGVTPITLTAGEYDFVFVQADTGGGGGAIMKWIVPGSADRVVIPIANLNAEIGIPKAAVITLTNNPSTDIPAFAGFSLADDSVEESQYVLERSVNASFSGPLAIASVSPVASLLFSGNMFQDTMPIAPSTTYYYRVKSVNPSGAAYSDVITVVTPASVSLTGDGLAAHYFNGRLYGDAFSLPQLVELDAGVDHAWGDPGGPGDPIGVDQFSARWTGKIRIGPGEQGDYTFRVYTDDGARLWVDGASVVDSWVDQGASHSATKNLSVGEHDIMAEYYENGGVATFQLFWTPPGGTDEIIPADHMIPAAAAPAAATGGSSQATTRQVKLNWTDNAINEIQYVIMRSTNVAFTDPLAVGTVALNHASGVTMSFTDTTVAKDTKYWYRVVAQNYDKVSAALVITATTPAVDVVPDAPSNLDAASASYTGAVKIGLTWKDNSTVEDKFVIQRGTAPDTFDKTYEVGVNGTFFQDTDPTLVAGTTYYYRVRAENLTGPSGWTTVVSAVASNQPLPAGSGTGLVGHYFNNMTLAGDPMALRLDPVVNLNFDIIGPTGRPDGWPADTISAEWKGVVVPQATGLYTFGTTSDDGSRIYFNNDYSTPNLNAWRDQAPTFTPGTPVFLTAGKQYPIHIQYYENGGGASMILQWTTDGMGGYRVIPASQLIRGDMSVKPAAPTNLSIRSVHGLKIQLRWGGSADNAESVKLLRSVDGGAFAEYKTLDFNVVSYIDTDLQAGKTYAYKVVNHNAAGDSDPSNTVSAVALADNLPAVWLHTDIGTPGDPLIVGDASYAGGVFTLTGGGSDIWDWSDHFQYVYQPLRTDGMITAHVLTQGTNAWSAFAGVMIRNDLSATSPHIFLAMTPGYNLTVQQRWEADGNTRATLDNLGASTEIPIWLRLERKGNTILAYRSDDDGSTFTPLMGNDGTEIAVNLPLGTEVYIGLITDAWDNSTICTNTFDHVSVVQGNATGTPSAASDLTAAPGEGPNLITLSWTDNSNNDTGFTILRSTSSTTGFVPVGQVGANMTFFTDKERTDNTTYYYRVQANNSRASQPNAPVSNTANSQPSTGPAPLNYVNFADTAGLVLNPATNVGTVDDGNGNTVIQLTDDIINQIGAVFTEQVYDVFSFTANFDIQLYKPDGYSGADGMAFVIQNIGVDALGGTGGAMGYENIGLKSVAIKFDFYPQINTTGLYQFGDGLGETARALDMGAAGIGLQSNTVYHVELLYDGSTLRQTVTNPLAPSIKWTHDYENVNLPAVMQATTAYIGFVGATGSASARQWVRSFSFDNATKPTIQPLAQPWVVNAPAYITLEGTDVKVWPSADQTGTPEIRALSSITTFTVNGDAAADTVVVDFSGGSMVPAGGMTINLAGGSDTVRIIGTNGAEAVSVDDTKFTFGEATVSLTSVDLVQLDQIAGAVEAKGAASVRFAGTATLASLTLSDTAMVSLTAGGEKVLKTGALSIGLNAALDLNDGDMIVTATAATRAAVYASVFNAIKSGRAGGTWAGKGLTSTTAKNQDPLKKYAGLASMINDRGSGEGAWYVKFDGIAVTKDDILVKYSWNGDANLDGIANIDDYFRIDAGFITQVGGFQNGDFNYDGITNIDDYFLIDSAFLGQTGKLAADEAAEDVVIVQQAAKKQDEPSVLSQLFSDVPVL